MSKQAAELYGLLKGLNDKGISRVIMCSVASVDKSNNTCTVLYDNDITIEDVWLKAKVDNNTGVIVYPSVSSDVLIERMDDGYFIIRMLSEIESVVAVVGDKKYMLDANGHYIGNTDNTLLSVINLIIDAIMKTIVFQGQNPDYQKLLQAKQMVSKILQ